MTDLKELTELRSEYLNRVKDGGKNIILSSFKEFFEANPTIKAIAWYQYAPSFNDGEPCMFSVHDFYAFSKEVTSEELNEEMYLEDHEAVFAYSSPESKLVHKFQKSFEDHDELFKLSFGDGVRVLARPDSISVDEYNHD